MTIPDYKSTERNESRKKYIWLKTKRHTVMVVFSFPIPIYVWKIRKQKHKKMIEARKNVTSIKIVLLECVVVVMSRVDLSLYEILKGFKKYCMPKWWSDIMP
jgi:hypothetical protein